MADLLSRVRSAALDHLGFRVSVADVREPAPGFALITLAGAGLTEHAWNAGDRVSVRTPDNVLRNYTPFNWDANAGRAQILRGGRASGPGTRFLNALSIGGEVQLLGPKKSIDLHLQSAPIIVGDETVLGLCAAWTGAHAGLPATILLEATDVAACRAAAIAIGVTPERVVRDRDSLVAAVIECARADAAGPLILSGRAQTIAAVRRALKNTRLSATGNSTGSSTTAVVVKAYWDENRAGLD